MTTKTYTKTHLDLAAYLKISPGQQSDQTAGDGKQIKFFL